jgi:hypothetical protein
MRVSSKQQARGIAAAWCAGREWPFVEPVLVCWRPFTYQVWTNGSSRGGNVFVRVRKRDGQVLHASIMPR